MKTYSIALVSLLWLGISTPGQSQNTILAQHSGSVNPTTEGFGLSGFGYPQLGPVTNDQGLNAWSMVVSNSSAEYYQYIGSLTGQDWLLTATLRVVTTNCAGQFGVAVNTGSSYFGLGFGSDANGNQIAYGITNGGGSIYNTYQLLYSSASDTASLWINGVERVPAIQPQYESGQASWGWDGGIQGTASFQANWNSVSLTVPEPSSAALVLLGGGVLFYVRHRKRSR